MGLFSVKCGPKLIACWLRILSRKQFGPRSGCHAWSGSKLFDTLVLCLKDYFDKDKSKDEKYLQTQIFISVPERMFLKKVSFNSDC